MASAPSPLSLRELELRSQAAHAALPDQPLREHAADVGELRLFDVVLAVNLDPPWRYAQDILWLETLTCGPVGALRCAQAWVDSQKGLDWEYEVTGMLRPGSLRAPKVGDLLVRWNTPIDHRTPPGALVRDPISGLRVGYTATPAAEDRHLTDVAREQRFRLLTKKPLDYAEPVCLAPEVVWVDFTGAPVEKRNPGGAGSEA